MISQEQDDKLLDIRTRLNSSSKVEQAKHYGEDVQFLIELVRAQTYEIVSLTEKVQEITIGDHEQAFVAVNKIVEVCSQYGFALHPEG